jgi:hypothetical protein
MKVLKLISLITLIWLISSSELKTKGLSFQERLNYILEGLTGKTNMCSSPLEIPITESVEFPTTQLFHKSEESSKEPYQIELPIKTQNLNIPTTQEEENPFMKKTQLEEQEIEIHRDTIERPIQSGFESFDLDINNHSKAEDEFFPSEEENPWNKLTMLDLSQSRILLEPSEIKKLLQSLIFIKPCLTLLLTCQLMIILLIRAF